MAGASTSSVHSIMWRGFEEAKLDRYTLRYVMEMGVSTFFECRKCEKLAIIDATGGSHEAARFRTGARAEPA